MINKKYLKLLRSQHRFDKDNFIYNIISQRIIDSLDLLKFNIDNVLEIGINENKISKFVKNKFNNPKVDKADLCMSKKINNEINFLEIDIANLNPKTYYYDLVYSNFFIHLTNNFEDTLKTIFNCLKSNSFFITAIPASDNMFQIINSMYETDLLIYGGAYQRVNPTIEINNIFSILKNLNFENSSIYSETIKIEYSIFKNLLKDIKKMNLSYCHQDKRSAFENKRYFYILEKFYKKNYFNECYHLDLKINIISSWKK